MDQTTGDKWRYVRGREFERTGEVSSLPGGTGYAGGGKVADNRRYGSLRLDGEREDHRFLEKGERNTRANSRRDPADQCGSLRFREEVVEPDSRRRADVTRKGGISPITYEQESVWLL